LSVILIQVPLLSERKEDIPLLVSKFLKDIAAEYGTASKSITESAIKELQKHPWTGNIRELRNVVERLIIMCGSEIGLKDVQKYALE
jgi:DNA-binding NtrC family response regulator